MSLDCSHDAWSGAYPAFSRWRDGIARAAGYAVWPTKLPCDDWLTDMIMLDWGHIPEDAPFGHWPDGRFPGDPLVALFIHADSEGMILPEHCQRIADRLEELLPKIVDRPVDGMHVGNWWAKTRRFITGLREAVAANEPLEFQ